jgi:hypothetical protein
MSLARRGSRNMRNIVLIVQNVTINIMSHWKPKVSVFWRKFYKREIPWKGGIDKSKCGKVWGCWQSSLQKHAELEWFAGKLYDLAAVYFIARGAMIMDRLFLNEWESRFYVLSLSLLAPTTYFNFLSCVGIKFMRVYTSENRFGTETELLRVGSYLCYAGYSKIYISTTNTHPLPDFVSISTEHSDLCNLNIVW